MEKIVLYFILTSVFVQILESALLNRINNETPRRNWYIVVPVKTHNGALLLRIFLQVQIEGAGLTAAHNGVQSKLKNGALLQNRHSFVMFKNLYKGTTQAATEFTYEEAHIHYLQKKKPLK
ncbi:hypothetical protein MTO96_036183 [Rhipicephalus appendiculatus]|uniref:8.9 kDa family member n=1 Tax=Rhipicephalus appendiculatus TaxID=34631 RepID=A0A131YMA9_RHIAP